MEVEYKIMKQILIDMLTEEQMDSDDDLDLSTVEGIQEAWEQAEEYNGVFSDTEIIDEVSEFRDSGQSTNLTCKGYSRHYESEQVARKLDDGTYVSWIYWSGGGKHGEPEAVDWMDGAFEVNCVEEQKMVTVYNYSHKD
jgi:hypothetical protein